MPLDYEPPKPPHRTRAAGVACFATAGAVFIVPIILLAILSWNAPPGPGVNFGAAFATYAVCGGSCLVAPALLIIGLILVFPRQ